MAERDAGTGRFFPGRHIETDVNTAVMTADLQRIQTVAHPRTYWKYEQFLLPPPSEQRAEIIAPGPSRHSQCFEQKALGWGGKSAL